MQICYECEKDVVKLVWKSRCQECYDRRVKFNKNELKTATNTDAAIEALNDLGVTTMQVTMKQFYTMLIQHDWFYSFSDDGRVFKNGVKAQAKLETIAERHPLAKFMYNHVKSLVGSTITNGTTFVIPTPKAFMDLYSLRVNNQELSPPWRIQ